MTLQYRPRRIRSSDILRDLTAEIVMDRNKLIMPHFVTEGKGIRDNISSMEGIDRVSIENLLMDVKEDYRLGIKTVLLFGIPNKKDSKATEAYSKDGIIQKALRELKNKFDDLLVITDVCLCEYTDHGHCGIIHEGNVLNDATLELLALTSLSHAEAGADIIAPSDMMDGRVAAIREELDSNGFENIPILSYAAKYSSAFYGPFRDAAGSAPQFGDRRSYQMDFRNSNEALKEVLLDIDEGADMVMVKPALSYLDIIHRVKEAVDVPLCAYNVSGEYSMVKTMQKMGFGDERRLGTEILGSIFRAGADMIISYHTRDVFRDEWF